MYTIQTLEISDFMCLYDDNFLSNFVIDICLAIKAIKNQAEFRVLYCNEVTEILSSTELNKKQKIRYNFEENSVVIMPWHIKLSKLNHWIIAIINFQLKECYILDPMNPTKDTKYNQQKFQKLYRALKKHCTYAKKPIPRVSLVQCKAKNIPKQVDAYNCGVYIIYYAITIMNKSHFDKKFNPNTYRNELKSLLLENSGDMENICLYCQKYIEHHSRIEWVSCTTCRRRVVTDCIADQYRLNDYKNVDFYCILCDKTNN
ncbi:uncharacterized protein LOC126907548 [Daktulosphaira vitifoliae]|uniref:uncharacterized protein LOC126907548 n=1 Tax=Daktulosphaira vitifoliae TaxID=58002 RepID=UPI0021AABE59|nr:uncharacterized protein LOC126907548 [Daktulosphaira vitifoliae]